MEENKNKAIGSENDLSISSKASNYLRETGKWSQFLAVLGFVFIGLIVLLAFFAGAIFSALDHENTLPFPGFLIGIIYLLIGGLYFFPILYLYRFSTKIKTALIQKENEILENALENLKSHYKFIGIMTIIMLSLYLFIGVIAAIAALFA